MISDIKFNFKDLIALDFDLAASVKTIPLIAMKSLRESLGQLRSELRPGIPKREGKLQRSFGYSVKRTESKVTARFGFMVNKNVSTRTAIAANVLQAGGARPRKGKYLWIPFPGSDMTPRQLISSGNSFLGRSGFGNLIAFEKRGDEVFPAFLLKTFVKLSRPPIPIEQRVEKAAPEIARDIEETIASVIEAKKKVQELL